MTLLYRAIGQVELENIRHSGQLQLVEGSLEGKWFAESAAEARRWGQLLGGLFVVIEVEFPDDVAEMLFRIERLDNIGPARFADKDQLEYAVLVREITL